MLSHYTSCIKHGQTQIQLRVTQSQTLTIENNEDLLPLRVANLGGLAEEDLMLVADEDAVQEELVDGRVGVVS